jgi:transposase-like protein
MARRNMSAREQEELCEAWRRSGLNKTEFCLENNISRRNLYRWLRELRAESNKAVKKDIGMVGMVQAQEDKITFFKIPTLEPSETSCISNNPCYLEITLPNGITFKVKLFPNNVDKFLGGLLTWK